MLEEIGFHPILIPQSSKRLLSQHASWPATDRAYIQPTWGKLMPSFQGAYPITGSLVTPWQWRSGTHLQVQLHWRDFKSGWARLGPMKIVTRQRSWSELREQNNGTNKVAAVMYNNRQLAFPTRHNVHLPWWMSEGMRSWSTHSWLMKSALQ